MSKRLNLTGKKFGKLTVIEFSHIGRLSNSYWKVKCDCGTEKVIRGTNFTSGHTVSCGCFHKEYMKTHAATINDLTRLPAGEACFNVVWKRYLLGAKKRNLEFLLSKEQFKHLTQQNCHYCGQIPETIEQMKGTNGNFIYNGIDRKNNSMGYDIENCVTCCGECNWLKGSNDYDKFLDRIIKIAKYRSSK